MQPRLLVSVAMKKTIPQCKKTVSISDASNLMTEYSVGAIPIVDQLGRLIGIFSKTDALKAWSTSDDYSSYLLTEVGQFMTRNVITCTSETLLYEANSLLLEKKIHRLIVVDNLLSRIPVGMLSQTDIMRHLSKMLRKK